MSEVKRYSEEGTPNFEDPDDGDFVKFDDYARLEAECEALKADLIALNAWYWSRPVADVSARVLCLHEVMQAGDKP